MATMKQYSSFAALCKAIKAKGDELDQLIAQGIEYCIKQAMEGNFDSFTKLTEACPAYARKTIRAAEKVARETHKNKSWREDAPETARETAADELAERRAKNRTEAEEKRRKEREAKRRALAEAEAKREAEAEKRDVQSGELKALGGELTHAGGGEPLALTEEEYQAALAAIQALRQGKSTKAA